MDASNEELARAAAEAAARDSYGKLVAFLSARTRNVAAAEDALSDAFAAALTDWPVKGVPDRPEAWLLAVARRKAIVRHLAAVETLYHDFATVDQRTRTLAYEKAMEQLAAKYPDDPEARIFYALSLDQTALPADKTYANQLKAAAILEKEFERQPDHPGITHYIIHSFDAPPLAQRGLEAARRYAKIAPAVPHALHMPSHTFTRVGAWQESIDANRASADAARKDKAGATEELHALDYQVYAYLQTAQDAQAKKTMDEIGPIGERIQVNVPGAAAPAPAGFFALAAIPARYALERNAWAEAARLTPRESPYAYTQAITYFARAIGAARTKDAAAAQVDVEKLATLRDGLLKAKDAYWSEQVEIQRQAASAWIALAQGRTDEALRLARETADREDATEKSAITPGPIKPARELLGDMRSNEGEALRSSGGTNLSNLPIHMADMGTDNYEQEFTLGLVEKERNLVREINRALAKIQDGSFGICEGTGKPISKPRLEAQPWTRYSIEWARQLERGGVRG